MSHPSRRARIAHHRFFTMAAGGLATGLIAGIWGSWYYTLPIGWMVAVAIYLIWVWAVIGPMDASATKDHATDEDPRRATAGLLMTIAALASLGAVAVLVIFGQQQTGVLKHVIAVLGFVTVVLSWLLIQTLFTLRYAEMYYTLFPAPGGINFKQKEPPQYSDFAYLAFCVGMTSQVSDTDIENSGIRSTVLTQSLLAFVFGTGIIATLVNMIVNIVG